MTGERTEREAERSEAEVRFLALLERLLAIDATDLRGALDEAAQLVVEALGGDKVDALLYDPSIESLVALGTADTRLGRQQKALGMDRLQLANGGSAVKVFQTGTPHLTGHAEDLPDELPGIVRGLGIRSEVIVPLEVAGERRGVLLVSATQTDFFTERDLHFMSAVARWVGLLAHRAELVERIAEEAAARGRRVAAEELITVLAHDLRNYITPIRGRLARLQRQARQEGQYRYLQEAEQASLSVDRLDQLIGDLLDATRLEQGLFSLRPQQIDLVALIRETVEPFQTEMTAVEVHADEAEMRVQADPQRLRQALENLIGNGITHSPRGTPVRVQASTEQRGDRRWATVTISDRGPGISTELLPHLFDRFAAGPGSTGLGLGLYLARRIAEAHGGTLTVESSAGSGAHFTLALPTLEGSADSEV